VWQTTTEHEQSREIRLQSRLFDLDRGTATGGAAIPPRPIKKGEELNMTRAKAQLVLAVRIPKNILEQANLQEGEELKVRVEDGSTYGSNR
jgi:hypothetical protein